MKRRILPLSLLFFACVVLAPWEPWSATGPLSWSVCRALSPLDELRIRSTVKISNKQVVLLDLCHSEALPEDWKTALGDVVVGDAPEAGKLNYVYPENLKTYLVSYLGSEGVDTDGMKILLPPTITVESDAPAPPEKVSQETLETIYKDFIFSHAPWKKEEIVITKVSCPAQIALPPGEVTHEVEAAPMEKYVGAVRLTIDFFVNGQKIHSAAVSGKVDVFRKVVQARQSLKQDQTISPQDVEVERVNLSDPSERYFEDVGQVVGKRILKPVGSRQPIVQDMVGRALSVKRGDIVDIVFVMGGMKMSAKGAVQENASMGDTVRVDNSDSHKMISGRVVDDHTVKVTP